MSCYNPSMRNREHVQAVLEDWDDTVAQGFDIYKYFYFALAERYGWTLPTVEGLKRSYGQTIAQIAHEQWPYVSITDMEQHVENFIPTWENKRQIQLIPGARQTIRSLNRRKVRQGIISSGHKPQLLETYRRTLHHDLAYHEIIHAPPDEPIKKPSGTIFDQALLEMNLRENEIVYIGDNLTDMISALERGVLFIAVCTGVVSGQQFSEAGLPDDQILETFAKLPYALLRLNSKDC